MNDDQQPNQDKPDEMTNPWPEAQKDIVSADSPSDTIPADVQPSPSSSDTVAIETPIDPHPDLTPQVSPPTPQNGQPIVPVTVAQNPGQTLGIVSIVLGVFGLWFVGLPLAIVSTVKSSKAHTPKALGIVGIVLNILSLLFVTFMIVVLLISWPALQAKMNEDAVASNSTSVMAGGTILLTTNYTPKNADVTLTVPKSYIGWTTTSIEKDGINEFTKDDDSATFMTYHGTLAGHTGTDKEVTQKAMADYITQLDAIEVSNSESTVSIQTTSGKMLQFETKQITAESESKPVKGIVAVRMYGGHELSIIYLAGADSFSMSDWDSLTNEVKISDGTS